MLVLRRLRLAREERRLREAQERLRPLALALLEGDARNLPKLEGSDARVLASLLTHYSKQLSGEPREVIAAYFERSLGVAHERSALYDRRPWRRATAAYALGDMASNDAAPALLKALDDPEREVRASAARSLGLLREARAVAPLVGALARRELPHGVAAHALLELGAAALPSLRELALQPDPEVRAVAVELIGLLGDAADAGLVAERLRDPAAEVRARAARAVGRLGAAEATAELRRLLDDRIPFVRATAAKALGLIGDLEAVPRLLELARSDVYAAAQAAARALARLDPQGLERAAAASGAGAHLHEAFDLAAVAS